MIPNEYPLQIPIPYDVMPPTVPQYAEVSLTSAQILHLKATPVEIVPSPGTGYFILPVHIVLQYFGDGATPYDVSGGGSMNLYHDDTGFGSGAYAVMDEDILTETTNQVGIFSSNDIHGFDDVSVVEDKALTIVNGGAGEYADGTGTAKVGIHYLVIPLGE